MVLCILGLPGTGKTTLVRNLERLGAVVLHPGKHAFAKGFVDTPHASRQELLNVPGLTESFLAAVEEAQADGKDVIIDAFPRTDAQVKALLEKGWNLVVIYLAFPAGREFELSVERQNKRIADDKVTVDPARVAAHTQTAIENDEPAAQLLRQSGCRFQTVDALLPPEEVARLVGEAVK